MTNGVGTTHMGQVINDLNHCKDKSQRPQKILRENFGMGV